MSATDDVAGMPPTDIGAHIPLPMLVLEATRQLNVCNACRYCEGFCAVFPSLERRSILDGGDISQIANLCHDCRACFDACMYSPPHEFAINIPKTLSAVREADFSEYVWPRTLPRAFRGWFGVFSGALLASLIVIITAMVNVGASRLVERHSGAASPYTLIPYPVLLIILLVPALYSVIVMGAAARNYWRATGSGAMDAHGLAGAIWEAASLRYLRGGGVDCHYPDDEKPSGARRTLHMLVAYGFGLCVVSTMSAGIMQDFLSIEPPYSWASVPVISGTVGGIGLIIGCVGLIRLKAQSSEVTSFALMTVKDYGFLVALIFLALTGLAALLTRTTSAYGIVYLLHLAGIVLCFAAAPYSKFMHITYRFLALLRDNLERDAQTRRHMTVI